MGGEGVDSFVVKYGRRGFSCSGGYFGYNGVWEGGILVIGRSQRRCK